MLPAPGRLRCSGFPRRPVVVPAGRIDPEPPESGADETPPAGTVPAPAARHHPDGVPSGRDLICRFVTVLETDVKRRLYNGDDHSRPAMCALVAGSHAFSHTKDVDGQIKSGHDGGAYVGWVERSETHRAAVTFFDGFRFALPILRVPVWTTLAVSLSHGAFRRNPD